MEGWPGFCALFERRGLAGSGTGDDDRAGSFSCPNQSSCQEPPSGFDGARNGLLPILPLRPELTAPPLRRRAVPYFASAPLPDSPGTGAAADGRSRRTAGGGSVPLPGGAIYLGLNRRGPNRPLFRNYCRMLPHGSGSRGQALSASWSRFGACGGRLRLPLLGWEWGLIQRRLGLAGWVPTLGRAAGETRPSFGNNRWV